MRGLRLKIYILRLYPITILLSNILHLLKIFGKFFLEIFWLCEWVSGVCGERIWCERIKNLINYFIFQPHPALGCATQKKDGGRGLFFSTWHKRASTWCMIYQTHHSLNDWLIDWLIMCACVDRAGLTPPTTKQGVKGPMLCLSCLCCLGSFVGLYKHRAILDFAQTM